MAMLCPNCRRRIHQNVVRFSSCHTGFPNAPLEELGHLAILHARLDAWERQGTLAPPPLELQQGGMTCVQKSLVIGQ